MYSVELTESVDDFRARRRKDVLIRVYKVRTMNQVALVWE